MIYTTCEAALDKYRSCGICYPSVRQSAKANDYAPRGG